ncbi:transcriptional repressor [Bowdeniella nasicola]|uniref:Transcriptional repressor n=2 Tax=Bowdeniella nasicola TaxID=208480 RepID=A0A1Q5Q2M2_9ACTO|nr:Fur family transcriptional regulator [Bowdeniella nasicola]OKL54067.1 transcriptional repressor [Bowdeniella nasicola]
MQRMTRQRIAVTSLMESLDDFRSAQQLHDALRERGENVGLATVYRTLQSLADAGVVDVLRLEDENVFRMCSRSGHHHHLVCRACGRTVELTGLDVEKWAKQIAREHGFEEVDHTLELFGLCAQCAAAPNEA